MKKHLCDIFNDNVKSSKISLLANSLIIILIIISTFEIILQTEPSLSGYSNLFDIIYNFTSIFFLFEVILRFYASSEIDNKYEGFIGKLKFAANFYTFIDIIAVIPFLLGLIGFEMLLYLKAIRVLRILKYIRYMPSVDLLQRAIANKKNELLISLQAIFIVAILLSIGLYYAESRIPNTPFNSIMQAFLWSLAKFIGSIAGYGDFNPVTTIGKFLATLNGVLGIAIFALPAGIIASGFVDEIGKIEKLNNIKIRIGELEKLFSSTYKKRVQLGKHKACNRFFTFDHIQARLLYSEAEILEIIRNSNNLRFRAMKSSEDVKYNDIKIIERFKKNTSYGCKIINPETNVFIINSMGASERCISHYTHTIVDNLGYNYLSREIRLRTKNDSVIASNYSEYYPNFENYKNEFNIDFIDFIEDIKQIKKDDFVIVLCSGAADRGDFIVEYGNKKGETTVIEGTSTVQDKQKIEQFILVLQETTKNFKSKVSVAKEEEFSFNIENHTIGNYHSKWIGKFIHNQTGANVFTLYVNIRHLIGNDRLYFASLHSLMLSIQEVFGSFKE